MSTDKMFRPHPSCLEGACFIHVARPFLPDSEELLGLRLAWAFGGRGGFGVSGEETHNVPEGFAYLSSESVGVLQRRKSKIIQETREVIADRLSKPQEQRRQKRKQDVNRM